MRFDKTDLENHSLSVSIDNAPYPHNGPPLFRAWSSLYGCQGYYDSSDEAWRALADEFGPLVISDREASYAHAYTVDRPESLRPSDA